MIPEPEKKKHLVCAIYTRKSTTEGLDKDFTSLDNQRESAENYIKSQQNEGWTAAEERYDDGGFTGANIERPALQKLLNHIKEGRINCVVVYKVDRLSRSLLDFSQLLEFFDNHQVVFVSITQHFNTNTSMGRLTLNILLSFAQFEREIISERTRDKMGAARKRGQWLGGRPPYGYKYDPTDKKKLVIDPETSATVRRIFSLYLEKNSALEVSQIMNAEGHRTVSWTSKTGKIFGNKKYSLAKVLYIINNPAYAGKIDYKGQIYPGLWPAIIDEKTYTEVHDKLAGHRKIRKPYRNTNCSGLLAKVVKCKGCGSALVHTYTLKKDRNKYRYYLCSNSLKRGYTECPVHYINAPQFEEWIIQILRSQAKSLEKSPNKSEVDAILSPVWDLLFFEEKRKIIQKLIKKAEYDAKARKIYIVLNGSTEQLVFDSNIKKNYSRENKVKLSQFSKEPPIKRLLLFAHQLTSHINDQKIKDLNQASSWLGINQSRLNHILGLLQLSPSIQSEIMIDNSKTLDSIPEYKIRSLSSETDWSKQALKWEELKRTTSFKNSISDFLKPESVIPSKWLLKS